MESKERVVILTGQTGVGKTEVSLELAKMIDCEIICCDSMQVYKGMDLITCKVSKEIRETIPHHLLDIISPEEEFNVVDWLNLAEKAIEDIHRREKIPLIVGGSMLYLSCLLDGIFLQGKSDKSIRNLLYKESEDFGRDFLYQRLKEVDLTAAEKIHPHDLRRIIRALEVYQLYNKPISLLQKNRKGIMNKYYVRIFGLLRSQEEIYERIEKRTKKMFEEGVVDEVKSLLKLNLSKTAQQAIGIKEIKHYLEGRYSLEELKRLISKNTRNYSRRQMSWFKKDKRIEWIKIKEKDNEEEIAQKIYNLLWNEY